MSKRKSTAIDIDLFAGAGGLALGLGMAGFAPAYFFEQDQYSCATLDANTKYSCTLSGPVHREDIRNFDWGSVTQPIRLLAAGAPCQPFSLGGKHLAQNDGRNLFPEIARAIREIHPEAVLIENVKGLVRHAFAPYFEYVLRCLEFPSLKPKKSELWQTHNDRIRREQRSPRYQAEYNVTWRVLDAADYGVPQNRLRVFIVATRNDKPKYDFPKSTHSRAALIQSQSKGTYWDRNGIRRRNLPRFSETLQPIPDGKLPWLTVREAIMDLPEPAYSESHAEMNHWHIRGARHYAGHDGSALDWPSKTIKAGVHGVPGGENSLRAANGKLRYYTLRETARIQTFPDAHYFEGARIHVTRQIGNAVPSLLGKMISTPLFALLNNGQK